MSWFSSTRQERVSSTIPTDVSPEDVVDFLHDHESFMRVGPLIFAVEKIKLTDDRFLAAETQSKDAQAYRLHEKLPLWGTISYTVSMTDTADGVDSIVNAPLGLKMWLRARVVQLPNNSNWSVLQEDCTFQVNLFLMLYTVWTWRSAHATMHERILKMLANSSNAQQ